MPPVLGVQHLGPSIFQKRMSPDLWQNEWSFLIFHKWPQMMPYFSWLHIWTMTYLYRSLFVSLGFQPTFFFFLVEKLCMHFHDILRCIQLFGCLFSYCVTPPEVHEPPEGKESLEPPCPPATPTIAWILGLLCHGVLLFLANFIFQELSSVFKNSMFWVCTYPEMSLFFSHSQLLFQPGVRLKVQGHLHPLNFESTALLCFSILYYWCEFWCLSDFTLL